MGIGQVSHCQAQGHRTDDIIGPRPCFAGGQAEGLCQVWMELIKSFCHGERRQCHALCPHFTMDRIFPTEIAPSAGAGEGAIVWSNCLSTAHECDRHTRWTDGHSCSSLELELEAVGLRSISFLVPNLVKFSSRDLKVLIVSASMTSCDKWFQFCSTRWLQIFYVGLVIA